MDTKNIAIAGAGATLLGAFLPIVSLPIVGTVNLVGDFTNWPALALMALAGLAGFLSFNNRLEEAWWPGLAALAMVVYMFVALQIRISNARSEFASAMADNPFGGLAESAMNSIQLQWGWLVLFGGTIALVYASFTARKASGVETFAITGEQGKIIAAASAVLFAVLPLTDAVSSMGSASNRTTDDTDELVAMEDAFEMPATSPGETEEADYIANHMELYDLETRYMDSMLDGRVPGVDFKIRNNGERTLERVKVLVEFQDANGQTIAEEDFLPVLVSEYSFGGNGGPLRPGYIWQQERGRFYSAPSVPSEWQSGAATARILEIEFAPEGEEEN